MSHDSGISAWARGVLKGISHDCKMLNLDSICYISYDDEDLMPSKYWLISVFYLLIFFSTAASANNETILRITMMTEFEELNPLFARLSGSKYLLGFTSRPLMHISRQGEIVSDLLNEIPPEKLEPYSKVDQRIAVTLKLRDDVYWADGSKLTTQDIVYTLSEAKTEINKVPNSHIYSKIEKIFITSAKPQEMRIVFTINEPNLLRQLVNFRIIPKPKDNINSSVKRQNFDPLDQRNYNGPYYVSGFHLGKSISLIRNKHFKNNSSNIERIEILLHFHQGIVENELVKKNIDLIPSPGFSSKFAEILKKNKNLNKNFSAFSASSNKSVQMILSTQFEILNDQKVRQALSLSLPKFSTEATTIAHALSTSSSAHDSDLLLRLLQDAGWSLKNKFLRNKNGKKLKLNLTITKSPKKLQELAEHIRLSWEQIGIEVRIVVLDRKGFLTKSLRANNKRATIPLFILQAGPKHERTKLRELLAGNFNYNEWVDLKKANSPKAFLKNQLFEPAFSSNSRTHNVLDQLITENLEQEMVFLKLFYFPKVALVSSRINGLVLQNSSFPESYHSTFWSLSD
ncbi:MAG: ABC transporter substrate-binding protein [Oligoflexales bacterium]